MKCKWCGSDVAEYPIACNMLEHCQSCCPLSMNKKQEVKNNKANPLPEGETTSPPLLAEAQADSPPDTEQ